jgi:Ca2+-binding EF-hand superfamily protein
VPPAVLAQRRRRFMSYHPLLAALDADHDGEISAWEIDHAARSLKKLDRDHDGYLTADELIPFEMAVHAGLR